MATLSFEFSSPSPYHRAHRGIDPWSAFNQAFDHTFSTMDRGFAAMDRALDHTSSAMDRAFSRTFNDFELISESEEQLISLAGRIQLSAGPQSKLTIEVDPTAKVKIIKNISNPKTAKKTVEVFSKNSKSLSVTGYCKNFEKINFKSSGQLRFKATAQSEITIHADPSARIQIIRKPLEEFTSEIIMNAFTRPNPKVDQFTTAIFCLPLLALALPHLKSTLSEVYASPQVQKFIQEAPAKATQIFHSYFPNIRWFPSSL